MNVNYIALAVPFFLGSILLEVIITKAKNQPYYRFSDSIANLSNGIGQQTLGLMFKVIAIGGYTWVYSKTAFFEISMTNPWHWALALVIGDLCYYWFHRASHRCNILVGAHTVHHQSEEYNLTVALRQSWITRAFSWVFYLPLAFIGVPPAMFIGVGAVVLVYQFWIHTRFIKTMGPLEYVFVTPSHHRVHHGRNGRYLDSNYGAILILWDKLFGSFQKEIEPVEYGVCTQPRSWNATQNNAFYYQRILQRSRRARSLKDKLKVWFYLPEWQGDFDDKTPRPAQEKYDNELPNYMKAIVVFEFVLSLAVLGFLYMNEKNLSMGLKAVGAMVVIGLLTNMGAILDNKKWTKPLHVGLFVLFVAGGFLFFQKGIL